MKFEQIGNWSLRGKLCQLLIDDVVILISCGLHPFIYEETTVLRDVSISVDFMCGFDNFR